MTQLVIKKPTGGNKLPDVYDELVSAGYDPPFSIDLGCGNSKALGYVGFDIAAVPGVDVVCNLEYGIPLRDNCVGGGVANQFFEHLHPDSVLFLIDEVHRVFQVGAVLRIMVPHYLGPYAWADPGHRTAFAEGYFSYLTVARKRLMFNVGRSRFWEMVKLVMRKEEHYGLTLPVEIDVQLKKV